LKDVKDLEVKFVLNGWPQDESVFDGADAIIFYMDGGKKHEALQDGGKRLAKIDEWVKKGMSIGCLHYGVTVDPPDNGGDQFKRWIGGHYEENYSCNPLWEPNFVEFPEHPITRGVKPFQIKDEWYFNIRFAEGFAPNVIVDKGKQKFTPILVARPSDAVRNGPYVYPAGPYPHIQAAKGRQEAMMWAVERPRWRARPRFHRRAFSRQLGQRRISQDRAERARLARQTRRAEGRHRVHRHQGTTRGQSRPQTATQKEGRRHARSLGSAARLWRGARATAPPCRTATASRARSSPAARGATARGHHRTASLRRHADHTPPLRHPQRRLQPRSRGHRNARHEKASDKIADDTVAPLTAVPRRSQRRTGGT
jgi:hypothetical protein